MRKKLNVLWIINIVLPFPSKYIGLKENNSGGWLVGLSNALKHVDNINLGIATIYSGSNFVKCKDENIKYYVIPENKDKNIWKETITDFKPDIIHIHGSECPFGLSFQREYPKIKTVVSLQGIITELTKQYFAGVKEEILNCFQLRKFLRGSSTMNEYNKFVEHSKMEVTTLTNADAIIGRTEWDKKVSQQIVPSKPYYVNNEILRNEFYDKKWDYNNIDKHTIFFSNATYPIKGFHIMLDALKILVNKYPDVKVYLAGKDIYYNHNIKNLLLYETDYQHYLKKKIKKYHLKKHIVITGQMNAQEMVNRYLKSNVYVQCSSIENSSNALGEAMILGVPCVASNVGGTCSMLEDKKEGLLYTFGDVDELVKDISLIFDDNLKAEYLGKNARTRALKTHSPNTNADELVTIYYKVLDNK